MKNQKGFVWLPTLLVILGVLIVGGGAYYVMHQNAVTQRSQNYLDVTPTSQTSQQKNTPSIQGTVAVVPVDPSNNYGCYTKNGTAILLNGTVVSNADVSTFQDISPYGLCFGKDANHVYRDTSILAGVTPSTFKLLWYAKPGPVLFFQNGSGIIAFSYSSDADTAFTNSYTVTNGDATTFQEMLGGYDFAPWAKDKNNVYCDGQILQGANPATAQLDSGGIHLQVVVNGSSAVYDSGCHATASGSSSGSQSSVSGMSEYTDVSFGFSFWYPSSWSVSKLPVPQSYSPVAGETDVERLQISGGSGQDSAVLDVVHFPNNSITVPTAGCTGTYFYSASTGKWMDTVSGCDEPTATTPYTQTPNTMGGLPVLFTQAGIGGVSYIVPLNSTSLQTAVIVSSTGMYSILTPTADTIMATNPSAATPVSAAQQTQTIQAEQSAYAGQ